MPKINVLPFAVANLIAAGEVVDRPASVIKELMENSIDAGATRITVEIQNGGVTFMRVTDNGCGMEPEDIPTAIRRHATSKIRSAEDLDGILTLGFRGEALAAIASVSDLRIISKTEEAEFGTLLEAHCGEIVSLCEQGCSTGTSVIVENLFANVPARRKFLKKDVTESMAVTANVEKVALSNPHIAMRLIVDGNVKLETAGDGNLKNTIYSVFGKEFASRMIEVDSESEGIRVRGFIGRTDNVKANRNHQNFFINGRYVKSKTAMAALEQAYTSYLPPEKFPACVLYLSLNPARVDVNVHPAKLEVKFSNEKPVFEAVYYTVRTALESNSARPSVELYVGKRKGSPRVGGRVSDATLPVEDGRRESLSSRQLSYNLAGEPLSYDLKGETQPQPQMRMTAEEYRNLYVDNAPAHKAPAIAQKQPDLTVQNRGNLPTVTAKEAAAPVQEKTAPVQEPVAPAQETSIPAQETSIPAQEATVPVQEKTAPVQEAAEPIQEKPAQEEAPREIPSYRIVGEVFHSYVIVECEDKMLLVDKHAAHERILFEQLKAGLHQVAPTSQLLMLPVEVMMTSGEVEALKEYGDELARIGFFLRYARNTVYADAIPEGVESGAVADMLSTMAGRILNATGSVKLTRDIIFEKALYQAACKAAIKAGRIYADEHIQWIVQKLMEIPDITFCPHGRPVALELSHRTLDNQFNRTGF
ncbi:MAG: DNA mismatch repair endonuclease MutL [Clostridia bacterium]|nr:DNA mismatch repair endonuclease MutL [Clostridia bacterium]